MAPDATSAAVSRSDALLSCVLGAMSVFTMLMTIPQVLTIWVGQQAAGVSVLSWSAYLLSAILWFWYGLRKGYRGRFGMYMPPLLEALGKAELTHEARNNQMRAK